MGFDNDYILLNIKLLAGEYFCAFCHLLVYPNEALQAPCTHLYCKPCLTYAVSTTHACFNDEFRVTEADCKPLLESNKALADTIGKILVRCLYYRTGCTWQGPLSDCISHCRTCSFGEHRQVQEHAQICPGVASNIAGQPQAAQAAIPTADQQQHQQQYLEYDQQYPKYDPCLQNCQYQQGAQQYPQQPSQGYPPQAYAQVKTHVSTEAQTQPYAQKQFQPHARRYAQKLSCPTATLSKKKANKLALKRSTEKSSLWRLLVSTAPKKHVNFVRREVNNALNAARNFPYSLEFTLQYIGQAFLILEYHRSIRTESVWKNKEKLAALKIRNKYKKQRGCMRFQLRVLATSQACDVEFLKTLDALYIHVQLYADRHLSLAANTWNQPDDELEVRHLGDYLVGKRLIVRYQWQGTMRLLVAGRGVGVVRDILHEAIFDNLRGRIRIDGGVAESDSTSEESDDANKPKFEFHPPSDEDL